MKWISFSVDKHTHATSQEVSSSSTILHIILLRRRLRLFVALPFCVETIIIMNETATTSAKIKTHQMVFGARVLLPVVYLWFFIVAFSSSSVKGLFVLLIVRRNTEFRHKGETEYYNLKLNKLNSIFGKSEGVRVTHNKTLSAAEFRCDKTI